jgi:hypothetical protein
MGAGNALILCKRGGGETERGRGEKEGGERGKMRGEERGGGNRVRVAIEIIKMTQQLPRSGFSGFYEHFRVGSISSLMGREICLRAV